MKIRGWLISADKQTERDWWDFEAGMYSIFLCVKKRKWYMFCITFGQNTWTLNFKKIEVKA